jgi:hypothetical protein
MNFPPVKYIPGDYYKAVSLGFSGQNTPFGIKIVTGVSYALPIQVQERMEWAFKYLVGLPVALVLAVGSYFLGAHWAASGLIAFAALLWTYKIPGLQKALEYYGQTGEAALAVDKFGADEEEYVWRTALQMQGYDQFKGMTALDIEAKLKKWMPRARKWIASHKSLIAKYEAKLKTFPDYKVTGLK